MIQAEGLRKIYGYLVAVRDVSFEIPAGQIVALLGPNGAGKTTIMRMLTGYLAPSHGSIRIAGVDAGEHRLEAAARLGYLPENGPLYPDMTVGSLLHFFGSARGLSGERLAARMSAVIEQCELQQIVETPIGKLSKGLRQRVGTAQALLHDPDVLIMDEPTAGLDPNQIRRFRAHVLRLRGAKTVLMSTHILSEVTAVAERALLVHEGRLLFDGTPDEMCQNGSLDEAFYRLTREAC
jgi:ABC-2 type transport system ATP-binding protein